LQDCVWNDALPTWASILRKEGYVTGAFTGRGAISARYGFYKGFNFYNETSSNKQAKSELGVPNSDLEQVFGKTIDWIKEHDDRTFFLFLHTYEPHFPYVDEYFVEKEGIPKSDKIAHRTALYDGDIRRADIFVGKLMDELEQLKLADNTLLVVTSDHGEDMGERNAGRKGMEFGHGYSLYDELLLVPLIFWGPGIPSLDEGIPYQVGSIDILPTILDYLEYEQEDTFQGATLKSMIEGRDKRSRPAYSEATNEGAERESLRYRSYKYIHRLSYGQLYHKNSAVCPLTPLHEVYDLRSDPMERENIADSQKKKIPDFQKMITSLVGERPVLGKKGPSPARQQDKSFNDDLRALGYIR